jgi:hypothetical protein
MQSQLFSSVALLEQFFDFCSTYFLLLGWVLLALPRRWCRRVIQIAFGIYEGR